jgi:iron-sulfur cluster insertion protein|tara:strand:- start:152 stop:469 length:318 start_codon:yes stop_codon:yes gene_type:complete
MTNKIEFTDSAKKEIERIVLKKGLNTYFRISVKGGGCSGFKYNFTFDDKVNENDNLFGKTVIDKDSLKIIDGSKIDFKKELIGNSFVINNPKASSSCGCGLSFSV